jgi:MFS family permease
MSIEFPKPAPTEVYMGYMMMALTFGMTIGPVISAIVFPYFEYTYTFFFFAGLLILLGMLPIIFFIPERINYDKYAKKMRKLRAS